MKDRLRTGPLELMTFMNGLVFFAPVALLVRTRAGVPLERFFVLQAVLSLAVFLFEIPAGRLTDRIGCRNTLVLSAWTLLLARGLLLAAFLTGSFGLFLAEALVEGLSACLSSGTVSAYLYRRDDGQYVVRMARIGNCGTAGFIVSTVAYAALYRLWGLTGLLIATALAGAVGAAASLALEQETRPARRAEGPGTRARLKFGPEGAAIVATLACMGLATILINFFYVDKLQAMGIDEAWMTGVILGYSAIQLLAERLLAVIRPGKRPAAFAAALIVAGAMLAVLGARNEAPVALPVMLLLPLALTLPEIILEEIQNRMIDRRGLEQRRAEVLSIFNMGVNLVEVAFLFASARVAGAGMAAGFVLTGALLAMMGVGGWLLFGKGPGT